MNSITEKISHLSPEQRELLLLRLKRLSTEKSETSSERIAAQPREGGSYPASYAQERFWFLDQLMPGNPADHIPGTLRLRGELDVEALRRSLGRVVERHESLRTALVAIDGQPRQIVEPRVHLPLPVIDLRSLPAEHRNRQARKLELANHRRPFDLDHPPLLRFQLLRLEGAEHLLLVTMHHIIADGWSLGILVQEVMIGYQAFRQGRQPQFPELPIQYVDFSLWQREWLSGETLEEQLDYWRRRLAGDLPPLVLPTDRPRPSFQSFHGARHLLELPPSVGSRLRELGRRGGATLFMTLLAVYEILLARYSGQRDFLIGTPVANRNRPEIENLIGFFVNMLALRSDLSGDLDFLSLLAKVHETSLDAFSHQDLPFEKLVEELHPQRDPSRSPLFQVTFSLQNVPVPKTVIEDLELSADDEDYGTSQYDLGLSIIESADGALKGWIEYNTDLFDSVTIGRFCDDFHELARQVSRDPSRRISALGGSSAASRQLLLREWNDTTAERSGLSAHARVAARASKAPADPAVLREDDQLSYAELETAANRLAHHLVSLGVGAEEVVGVYMERRLELPVAVLAIWKAGGAYLPLDPEYPMERIRYILKDSGARVVVTTGEEGEALAADGAEPAGFRVCRLDLEREEIEARPPTSPAARTASEQAAYVIYTSGSTGRPKGTVISHDALANHLDWRNEYFPRGSADRVLHKTSIGFDTSLWELFEPLSAGGAVVLAEPGGQRDGAYLAAAVRRHEITAVDFVPSMLPFFLDQEGVEEARDLRRINVGGETLSPELERRIFERLPEAVVYSGYGPTEACIGVTFCARGVGGPAAAVPIGRPVANTRIYLLDRQGRQVPTGVLGQLAIAGASLARGYLERAALTAERFVPDPFARTAGRRLYLTGDLARWRHDGQLVFVGRVDHQVKVRGFRVELEEVEEVLRSQSEVREAVVTARLEGAETHQLLVAYLVTEEDTSISELRARVSQVLPDYMVPAVWMELDALPLTPSGKVDRRALPDPDRSQRLASGEYVAPRNPVEEVLAGIWTDLLDCGRVGAHDNFFELGGHSLIAIQMITRVREAFGIEVALRELFRHPTPAELGAVVSRLRGRTEEGAAVAVVPRIEPDREALHEPFPLADVQQAYWIGRSRTLELGGVAAHSYSEFEGTGWDLERLNQAIRRLVQRHDMLRAIVLDDGHQRILESVPDYEIEIQDLRELTPEAAEEAILGLRQRMSHQVIPADRWPLFEVCASLLDGGRVRLHVSIDGLIRDAWSARILWSQLAQFYLDPELELPPIELSFRDCVLAELGMREQRIYQRSLDYWNRRIPTLPPAPDVPMVKNLATVREPKFVRRWERLPEADWEKIKERGSRLGLTPTTVVLTVFSDVLAAWSRSTDFTANLTLFNRHPFHPQVGEIVGDFTSLIMVEIEDALGGSFAERAGRVQERLWDDLDHSFVSGVKVLRELARTRREVPRAYMPVVFTSTLALTETVLDTSNALEELPEVEMAYGISQTPQVTIDHQVAEQDGALIFIWDVVEDLFPPGLIADMFDAFHRLLLQLAASEEAWSQPPQPLLPAPQLAQRAEINRTDAPLSDRLLHQLFQERAAENPRAPAVIAKERTLSYGELQRRASELAAELRRAGAQPGRLIAVAMEKGWEQVVAVLAVLEAGAAYLPIDPGLPAERRRYLAENAEIEIVLTQSWLASDLEWPESVAQKTVDDREPAEEVGVLEPVQGIEDLAYVIYTSGSSGQPKGVMIDHRGAVNTLLDVNRRFDIGPRDRVLALSALNFDLSVYDVFGILAAGGALVMPAPSVRRDPSAWAELVDRHEITLWNSVPALMDLLVEWVENHPGTYLESLRLVLLSGDWLPLNLPQRIREQAPGAEVVSLGGATEASIWSILHRIGEVESGWKSIPYGKPMVNQSFHVLDPLLRPVPTWVPGELYIGGVGLAMGYWRDDEKTRASFLHHPDTGERLYRTGDLGRYREDGSIEFLGREDLQVKIQGHRIELGEIEAALAEHPGVEAAVVAALGGRHNKRLAGYFLAASAGDPPESEELSQFLGAKLPEYMVPGAFMALEAFPLSANGKVDRNALPEIRAAAPSARAASEVTGISRRIAELVAEVLGIEEVDPSANLIELGGSSIEIVRIANRLEDEFGFRPQMDEMFRLSIDGAVASFYEEHLERGEVYQAVAPPAADRDSVGGVEAALLAAHPLIRDPEQREEHKSRQPGLRRYPGDAKAIELSGPQIDEALKERYLARRSRRTFSPEAVSAQSLGDLLSVLRQLSLNGRPKYLYASAGGLYPLQTYLYVQPDRIESVAAGTYYYDPVGHRLVALSESARIGREVHGWINQPIFDQSAFSIFLIAEMRSILPMYGAQSLEFCAIEAGLMAQLLEETAPEHGLGLCQIGGLRFEPLRPLFDLEESQRYVYSLLGGALDSEAEAAARGALEEISDWEEGEL